MHQSKSLAGFLPALLLYGCAGDQLKSAPPVKPADAKALIAHAGTVLARYKLPKAVVFRRTIERSPAGKADYRWAKEQAAQP